MESLRKAMEAVEIKGEGGRGKLSVKIPYSARNRDWIQVLSTGREKRGKVTTPEKPKRGGQAKSGGQSSRGG